jgi:hypothetical protein
VHHRRQLLFQRELLHLAKLLALQAGVHFEHAMHRSAGWLHQRQGLFGQRRLFLDLHWGGGQLSLRLDVPTVVRRDVGSLRLTGTLTVLLSHCR